jgi:DNA-binding SARP family transcriptional activator/TolB-like protein
VDSNLEVSASGTMSAAAAVALRIHLFGRCRVEDDQGRDITPRARKARALLAYLALARDGAATRERLAGLLWGSRPDDQARASLRQTLKELRECMQPDTSHVITVDRTTVHLHLGFVWVDARELLQKSASASCENWQSFLELYRGDLFDETIVAAPEFEDWLYGERTLYRTRTISTLLKVLRESQQSTNRENTEEIARGLLAIEPAHEEAHRALIEEFALRGDTAAALNQYNICAESLTRAFDATPDAKTVELMQAVRAGTIRAIDSPDTSAQLHVAPSPSVDAPSIGPPLGVPIAVLPFASLNPGSDYDYVGTGLTEDLCSRLSRFRWLSLTAPWSTAQLSGQNMDPKEIGRLLNVRYLVTGNVRRVGERIRYSVQLSECEMARTVWATQSDVAFADLFQTYDDIVHQIAGQLDPQLQFAERRRALRKRPGNLDAYDCLLRAIPLLYRSERQAFEQAGLLLHRATELDPHFATAHAWLAQWYMLSIGNSWTTDHEDAMEAAGKAATLAIECDPDDSVGLAFAAHANVFLHGNFERARQLSDRGLELNPSSALGWALSACLQLYMGNPEEALRRMERYKRLSPFDPYGSFWDIVYVIAHLFLRNYRLSVQWGEKHTREKPQFTNGYKPLIASLGHLAEREKAKPYLERLLKLEPDFTIAKFRRVYPLERRESMDHYTSGLIAAGVPIS